MKYTGGRETKTGVNKTRSVIRSLELICESREDAFTQFKRRTKIFN